MRIFNYLLLSSLVILSATVIALVFSPSPASAISDYDNTIQMTDQLLMVNGDKSADVTYSIGPTIANACGLSSANSFKEAATSGVFAITKWTESSVNIYWSQDIQDANLAYFYTDWGFEYLHATVNDTSNTHRAELYLSPDGEIQCENWNNWYDFYLAQHSIEPIEPSQYVILPFASNWPVDFPDGYEGVVSVNAKFAIDNDTDGLTLLQELQQGTSDSEKDTDKDGIDDFKESKWFLARDSVFCKITVSPKVCSYPSPITKDVYLEIDWMNDGIQSNKPSSSQISLMKNAFTNRGINFHADIGDYGGGNELQSYTGQLHFLNTPNQVDFSELKNGSGLQPANFNSNRQNIWRYMISGYSYAESSNSSGVAEIGGDDIFVSNGLVRNQFTYTDLDRAIAGTMIHELGHSLCLSSTNGYNTQPSECVHSGVDSGSILYNLYHSAMNYNYQLDYVDYSDGSNGLNDHDDWGAVLLGMAEFSNSTTSLGALKNISNEKIAVDSSRVQYNEMTPEKSKEIYESANVDESKSKNSLSENKNITEVDENRLTNNEITPEHSKNIYESNQVYLFLAILGGVAVLVLTGAMLIVKKRSSKRKG